MQGSYIDIHDNDVVNLNLNADEDVSVNVNNRQRQHDDTIAKLQEVLFSSELWKKVKEAGLVDENDMPTISRTEAAMMADTLAERLGIKQKWKFFEKLWQRNNMRNDYNTALDQRKTMEFQERLKNILR